MLQCIFLLSASGEVMLEKQWIGQRVDRSICSWFWAQAHPLSEAHGHVVPSVMASPTYYLLHIVQEGVTFLACTSSEMPPLLGIEFLCRAADVLTEFLGGLNDDLIKDNFVIVYELLDEMMDGGFPLITEPNILKDIVTPPNLMSKVLSVVTGGTPSMSKTYPMAADSGIPWRSTGVKYSNNEIYFDLSEEMDAVLNRDGFLVKCGVYGEIQAHSRLSGMPNISLSFSNPTILNDVRFHPCVQSRTWEATKTLTFIPPDGSFKLLSYRVKGLKNTPIYVRPQLSYSDGVCRVNILVGMRSDPGKPVDAIVIKLPWHHIVSTDLTANYGTVTYSHSTKISTWSIGRIPKDKSPCLNGSLQLEPGIKDLDELPTLLVGFKVLGVALSGLKVDKMECQNVEYRAYKGFRAVTRAGSYEIRT